MTHTEKWRWTPRAMCTWRGSAFLCALFCFVHLHSHVLCRNSELEYCPLFDQWVNRFARVRAQVMLMRPTSGQFGLNLDLLQAGPLVPDWGVMPCRLCGGCICAASIICLRIVFPNEHLYSALESKKSISECWMQLAINTLLAAVTLWAHLFAHQSTGSLIVGQTGLLWAGYLSIIKVQLRRRLHWSWW